MTDRATVRTRRPAVDRAARPVVLVAVVGWLLRLAPLLLHGRLGSPVDYDEGVYLTAAALLARGHRLYRDVVIVHPPGLFTLLAPLTLLGRPSTALFLSQAAMAVVGGANVYLVGRLASRYVAPAAAVVGAAVYAVFPAAVRVERGVFLEPVLNLLCLGAALVWLREGGPTRPADRRAWATGALLGAAMAVKLWGGLALVACLASAEPRRWRHDGWRLLAGAAASFAVLVMPAAWPDPGAFVRQTVLFQWHRAPEPLALADRIRFILLDPATPRAGVLDQRSLIGAVIVALGVVAFLVGPRTRLLRFALAWYFATVTAFLLSASYFQQYNAHLAPALALMGAVAVDLLLRGLRGRPRVARRVLSAAGAVLVFAALLVGIRGVVIDDGRRSGDLAGIARAIRAQPGNCVFSFEPQWLLAADLLPAPGRLGAIAVDTYAAQLDAVVRSGRSPRNADAAFRDPASEALVSRAVASCDVVVLGERGRRQLGGLLAGFERDFHQAAATSDRGPDLWVRNQT